MFDIIRNQSKTIASAAVILGAASLVSRILGFVRNIILIRAFGIGDELDIYYAAFRIPDLVFTLLVMGAVSAGFVPVFVSYFQKNKSQAWHLANSVLNLMALVLSIFCLAAILAMPWLIRAVAPGFAGDKLALTIRISQIMFLSPLLLGISSVFGGVLQSLRCFLAYAAGPIVYNLGIIFGALVLVDRFGVFGLAYGVVLGAFLHMLIRIPVAHAYGFKWRAALDLKFAGSRRIIKLIPPRVLSLLFYQINLWAMTFLASFLAPGSITICNVALNVWSLPLGVFGASFTLAVFPELAGAAQTKNGRRFARTFSLAARQILFLALPFTFFFIILRTEIVRVIFGLAQYQSAGQDLVLTASVLAYFTLSLLAESLTLLLLRGFFAWEDAKTPFWTGLISTIVRVFLMWQLVQPMGAPGLALGFSIGALLQVGLLYIALKRKMRRKGYQAPWHSYERRILATGAKSLAAVSLLGVSVYGILYLFGLFMDISSVWTALIAGGAAGLLGVIVYAAAGWLLGMEEPRMVLSSIWRKDVHQYSGEN